MRDVVKTLWDNIINPDSKNEERMIDMMSFFTLVINGQNTNEEIKEIMES